MRGCQLVILSVTLLLVGCSGGTTSLSGQPAASATAAAPGATAPIADGARLYSQQGCARCHGDRGQGGRASSLLPPPADVGGWLQSLRAEHSRDYPASKLPDNEARAIYAWLRSSS